MTSTVKGEGRAVALIAVALALGVLGVYVAGIDDPRLPGLGPAGIGILLMAVAVVLGVRAARGTLPTWAVRTVLGVGLLTAGVAGVLLHAVAVAAPLFPQPRDVPSVIDAAPSSPYAPAVERGRQLARAAIVEQGLPGMAVAVGAGGTIVWAEGFGWRDVDTRTRVTPNTRFNIGTAAALTAGTAARLGLTHTGADSATEWSPEHIGEPEEDFPGFTVIRDVIFKPIGVVPAQPLPGDRATFYVPRSDRNPRSGRRLMYMRDLACCAGTMAFSSTAPDMVRVGMATGDSVDGMLAGGTVMSLVTLRDGVVVAVLSNIAPANTSALATTIGEAFSTQAR